MDGAGVRATDDHMRDVPENAFRRKADRTRWRNGYLKAFLVGYCDAVAERVAAARGRLRGETGASAGALVLASDELRVREEFTVRFPDLGRARGQRIRGDGFAAGRDAGRYADIGSGTLGRDRPALHTAGPPDEPPRG